jgi:large subunit ribosomal protein L6
MPIPVPAGVQVKIEDHSVTVKGPKGEIARDFHPHVSITMEGSTLMVSRPTDHRYHRSLHGTTRALLANMIHGVTTGFRKDLVIDGTGFRASQENEAIVLLVGYSHPVKVIPPQGVTLTVDRSAVNIAVEGIDKEMVGEVAAEIRDVRVPDPYKAKGIRYADERIRRKAGKAGKAAKAA